MLRAIKGCKFGGKNYYAGDIIPKSAVDSKALGALAKMKILEIIEDKVKPEPIADEKPKPKKSTKTKELPLE